jgi:hypothetical protein
MKAERAACQGRPEENQTAQYTKLSAETHREIPRGREVVAEERRESDMRLRLARGRFKWIRFVTSDPDLPDGLKLLLVTIALHMSEKKPKAWPSQMMLAEAIGKSDRQVRRLIKEAEDSNWLDVDHFAGGSFNQDKEQRGNTDWYYLKLPPHLLDLLQIYFADELDADF